MAHWPKVRYVVTQSEILNEFLNQFGIHKQPIAFYVLGKLMSWVIINNIYIIRLANLFLKLMTVTVKSNIDLLVYKWDLFGMRKENVFVILC